MAERCRQRIFDQQIAHAASPVGRLLTLSMGVGTITPVATDTPTAFLEAVDRRLYRAKQGGRNRIVAGGS